MEFSASTLISIFQLGAALSIAFGAYFYLHDVNSAALNNHLAYIHKLSDDIDIKHDPDSESKLSRIALSITQFKRGPFISGVENCKPFVGYAAAFLYCYALFMLFYVSFSDVNEKFSLLTVLAAAGVCIYPLVILICSFVCEAQIKSVISRTRIEAAAVLKAAQEAAIAGEQAAGELTEPEP